MVGKRRYYPTDPSRGLSFLRDVVLEFGLPSWKLKIRSMRLNALGRTALGHEISGYPAWMKAGINRACRHMLKIREEQLLDLIATATFPHLNVFDLHFGDPGDTFRCVACDSQDIFVYVRDVGIRPCFNKLAKRHGLRVMRDENYYEILIGAGPARLNACTKQGRRNLDKLEDLSIAPRISAWKVP